MQNIITIVALLRENINAVKKSIRKINIENTVINILGDLLNDSENLASLAVDASVYYKKYYSDGGYLDSLLAEEKTIKKSLSNILRAIEQGILSETTQNRLLELEAQQKALNEAIETETVKRNLLHNENSIQAYFDKYLHADFENHETRDMILEYFIDKIYLYDDRLVISGWYSGDKQEITWEELNDAESLDEFENSVFSSNRA